MSDLQQYIIRCPTCGREPDYPLLDEWYCADCWEEASRKLQPELWEENEKNSN